MNKLRPLMSVLAAVMLVGSIVLNAAAAPPLGSSSTCQSYAGSWACRKKTVASTGSSTWGANVSSYMSNPVISIDNIGWSYWTVRETCTGVITYQVQYGGAVNYNASSAGDSSAHYKHACSGTRWGWSLGNHDFYEYGYSHIYPYKEYYTGI